MIEDHFCHSADATNKNKIFFKFQEKCMCAQKPLKIKMKTWWLPFNYCNASGAKLQQLTRTIIIWRNNALDVFLLWCYKLSQNICWGYFWQIMISHQVATAGETDIVLASKVFSFVENWDNLKKSKSPSIQVQELGRRWSQLQNGLMRLQVIHSIIPVII